GAPGAAHRIRLRRAETEASCRERNLGSRLSPPDAENPRQSDASRDPRGLLLRRQARQEDTRSANSKSAHRLASSPVADLKLRSAISFHELRLFTVRPGVVSYE